MPSPLPDATTRARMTTAHTLVAGELDVSCHGPDVWGWRGRTLGRRASRYWLRLMSIAAGKEGGKLWDGTAKAEAVMPPDVPRPRLVDVRDWSVDGYAYRAELTEYVPRPVLSADGPDIAKAPDLPDEWWAALRGTLKTITAVPTERQAVRQQWIDRRFPEFLGIPGPTITDWETAHGDLHWGNLTSDPLTVLDWEGWGLAPRGYDAGMLHAYSLRVPVLVERVRTELSPVLSTPQGRIGELVALAELLQANARGSHPELGRAWAAQAEQLTGVRPPMTL